MQLRAACIQTHRALLLVDFYSKVFQHTPDVDGGVDFRYYNEQLTIFKLDEDHLATAHVALIYSVDDVDFVYNRLQAQGLCDSAAPTDKPWGVRSFMIHDPDGNTISFVREL